MKILLTIAVLVLAACSSKNKAMTDKNVISEKKKSEAVGERTIVGVDEDGKIVSQESVKLSEYLRSLHSQTKTKQDELFGSNRFGTRGLYGKLEDCVEKAQGKGQNVQLSMQRELVIKDTKLGDIYDEKVGYDEKGELVALNESKLRDRIRELESYRDQLVEKENKLIREIKSCETKVAAP